jgi:hypothetical protein
MTDYGSVNGCVRWKSFRFLNRRRVAPLSKIGNDLQMRPLLR